MSQRTASNQTILDKHNTVYKEDVEVVHIWTTAMGKRCGNAKIHVDPTPANLAIWPDGISFVAVDLFSENTWKFQPRTK